MRQDGLVNRTSVEPIGRRREVHIFCGGGSARRLRMPRCDPPGLEIARSVEIGNKRISAHTQEQLDLPNASQ
jgi:hypothetical protein